jgi:uncharacterized Zn-binding protein involved in type VI secretion
MPSVARGDGADTVFSKTGSGNGCGSPLTTATNECSPDVITNDIGTVRENDKVAPHPLPGCIPTDESVVSAGAPAVFANFQEVARIGDEYGSDNTITSGSSNVFAGNEVPIPPNTPGETIDGVFIPENPFQYFHAVSVVREAGLNATADEPDDQQVTFGLQEKFTPAADTGADLTPAAVDTGVPIDCGNFIISPLDYNQKLSNNFTVRNLSIGAVFPHSIVAQAGFDVAGILCNLKGLCENILEPLSSQYPGFRINSGFRKGAGTSQHNRGQACDLQWPGLAAAGYTPIAEWMRDNLPFDQLIFEHGKSIWIHVSYNRTLTRQRSAILTYYPPQTPQYRPGLTNYYA